MTSLITIDWVAECMEDGDNIAGANHVALTISDFDQSASWYEDLFELEVLLDEDREGRKSRVYQFAGTEFAIGLVQHGDGEAGFDPLTLVSTISGCESIHVSNEAVRGIPTGKGIAHSGLIDTPLGLILNFKDPDGIALSLFYRDS